MLSAYLVWTACFTVAFGLGVTRKHAWPGLICLAIGFLFLPIAEYPSPYETNIHRRWGTGQALFAVDGFNRMFWMGFAAWLMATCLHWRSARDTKPLQPHAHRFQWLWSLPLLGMSLWSGLAAWLVPSTMTWALAQSIYHLVTWGGCWALGWALCKKHVCEKQHPKPNPMVWIGLIAWVLACLSETVQDPWFYKLFYGVHPFQNEGDERYWLHRPLLFFEDGNQYGLFAVLLAVLAWAAWFKRKQQTDRSHVAPNQSGRLAAACLLTGLALASQSRGAVALALIVPAAWWIRRWAWARWAMLLTMVFAGVMSLALTVGVVSPKQLATHPMGQQAKHQLKQLGLGSFGWRVGNVETYVPQLKSNLFWGQGHVNWWQLDPQDHNQNHRQDHKQPNDTKQLLTWQQAMSDNRAVKDRPWPYWALATGAYGLPFTALSFSVLLLPAGITLWRWRKTHLTNQAIWPVAMALGLIIQTGDLMLNSTLLPMCLVAAGWLSAHAGQRLGSKPISTTTTTDQ